MDKRYDQRCVLCPRCHHFWKAGIRDTMGGCGREFYPDGCTRYGYTFHDRYEVAPECEGFETDEQYEFSERQKELLKKRNRK